MEIPIFDQALYYIEQKINERAIKGYKQKYCEWPHRIVLRERGWCEEGVRRWEANNQEIRALAIKSANFLGCLSVATRSPWPMLFVAPQGIQGILGEGILRDYKCRVAAIDQLISERTLPDFH